MQKQLKTLDEELNSNNLTRVPSSTNKSQKSLFRALSLSIYFNQDHIDEVIRIMRLCLVSSCNQNHESSFPIPHRRAKFITKFMGSQENIDMYVQNPDANCFAYDNLQIASLAFIKRVILFTVSKDGYLQENLITSSSKKSKDPPIMLAKISNRYFCVQSQATRSVMMFIRENIINRLMNLEEAQRDFEGNGENLTKSQYFAKGEKKSLSDSGDVMQFNLDIQQKSGQAYGAFDGTMSYQGLNYHPHQYQKFDNYLYHSDYFMSQPKIQRQVLPGQRYSGRLKFFDQNGNYGFIVVDGFGSDLFVHFDDLQKTGIGKQKLLNIRNSEQMRFQFTCLQYDGKYKKSKKAVDLKPIPNTEY